MTISESVHNETPIDLAREANLSLAGMTVSPSTLQVSVDGESRTLEPRIMQMLVALAKRRGEVVSHDDLWAAGWGSRVVGEDSLYRAAKAVRRLGEETGAFAVENVRRVGYRLTVAGEKSAPPAPTSGFARILKRRAWPIAGVAALVVLILAGVALVMARTAPMRVAVLAFETADPALHALAKTVTDRTLSETAGQAPTLLQTSSGRGAMLSVSGLIGRAGADYTASVHINDVADGATLWSAEVVGSAETLPRQVAAIAAGKVSCGLAAYRPSARLDQQSRSLWLEVCDYLVADGSRVESQRAAAVRLVARAPNFADGLAMKSIIDARRSQRLPPEEAEETLAQARADAAKAIKLNPDLGTGYVGQAVASPWRSWADQEAGLRRGLARAPNDPFLHSRIALMLSNVGRMKEAEQHAARSVELAPYALRIFNTRTILARVTGDIPAAQELEARIQQQWSDTEQARALRIDAALQDDPKLALALLADPAQRPRMRADTLQLLQLYAQTRATPGSDPKPAIEAISADLAGFDGPPEGAISSISQLLLLGDVDRSIAVLNRLTSSRQGVSPQVVFYPEAAAFRRDPRFPAFAERAGLIDYWRATRSRPDICTGPNPEPVCAKLLDAR